MVWSLVCWCFCFGSSLVWSVEVEQMLDRFWAQTMYHCFWVTSVFCVRPSISKSSTRSLWSRAKVSPLCVTWEGFLGNVGSKRNRHKQCRSMERWSTPWGGRKIPNKTRFLEFGLTFLTFGCVFVFRPRSSAPWTALSLCIPELWLVAEARRWRRLEQRATDTTAARCLSRTLGFWMWRIKRRRTKWECSSQRKVIEATCDLPICWKLTVLKLNE